MNIQGHMIDVTLTDSMLRVHGHNKAARIALAGEGHESDVIVLREAIAHVKNRRPSLMTNGNLIVTTDAGKRYQLHYRKKSQADFEALEAELQAQIPTNPSNVTS